MVVKSLLLIALMLVVQPANIKTILFFGDSLTAGYGLSPEEAFPALLEKTMNKNGARVRVVNAGLSGETSAGGLSRIDWILRQPIDIFVLELGANDGLRGLPLKQTISNLQAIIDKVKAKQPNVKIVMAGMMVPPNLGQAYAEEFRNIYPTLAKKNKATLIPFILDGVAGDEKLNQTDGIHPNVEGHQIIAKKIQNTFEGLVK